MARRGKKYIEAAKLVDKNKRYSLEEAVDLLKEMEKILQRNFDETVELAMRLNVDPRYADQMVRGSVVLPHGLGKPIRVVVFAEGEDAKKAEEAGADYVGGDELINKILKEEWTDFDVAIATPEMMPKVAKLGRILGPRGLMPSPKTGTVTKNLEQAIKEAKKGRVEFKVDKAGNIHMPVGKISFDKEKLLDNLRAAIDAVLRAKPPGAKGQYIKNMAVSLTMSPSVKIDVNETIRKIQEMAA